MKVCSDDFGCFGTLPLLFPVSDDVTWIDVLETTENRCQFNCKWELPDWLRL